MDPPAIDATCCRAFVMVECTVLSLLAVSRMLRKGAFTRCASCRLVLVTTQPMWCKGYCAWFGALGTEPIAYME